MINGLFITLQKHASIDQFHCTGIVSIHSRVFHTNIFWIQLTQKYLVSGQELCSKERKGTGLL